MAATDRTAAAAIAYVRQIHALRAEHGYMVHDYDDDAVATVLAELERLESVEQELEARKAEDRNVDRTLALLLMRLGGDVEFSRVELEAAPRRGEFVTAQTVTGGMRLAFQAAAEARAELVTWCRIMCVGPACAKPCDDCRRDSARNAKMPAEIRASITAARAELGLPPETGPAS